MGWRHGLRARLRAIVARRRVERDAEEELAFHLELETERNLGRGMSPEEARRRAHIALGGVERSREALRDLYPTRWLEDLAADARLAWRGLRRSPVFALVAVLTLGLGIGAATVMSAAVDAMLLRSLPFADAERLTVVYGRHRERGLTGSNVSYPDYLSWKSELASFSDLALFNAWTGTFAGGAAAERINGAEVSAGFFSLLGVEPELGRGFLAEEELAGRDAVVVLSQALWQRRFGGERSVLGRLVEVDGALRRVVGVAPPGFGFPFGSEAWIPLVADDNLRQRGNRMIVAALGRLAPGIGRTTAQAEIEALSRRLAAADPASSRGWDAEVVPLREDLLGAFRPAILVVSAAVALVLLVACFNVANLLLARSAARREEIALRHALGAGRWRLLRQLLAEGLVLAGLGGALGLAVAAAGTRLAARLLAARLPGFVEIRADSSAFVSALVLTAAVGLLVGSVPAFRTALSAPQAGATPASRSTAGRSASRLRAALVVAEIALTVVLVVGALLLVRSLRSLDAVQLGFDPSRVLTARYTLAAGRYEEAAARRAFTHDLLERLAALPGVEAVAAAQGTPYSGWNVGTGYEVEGEPPAPPGEGLDTHCQAVTPGFFAALGVPILRGTDVPGESAGRPSQVVINASLAARHFAAADPLGKRLRFGSGDSWATIVGVVGDFRHYRLVEPMKPAVYVPYADWAARQMTLVVRTSGPPADLVPALRATIAGLDPAVPAYRVETLAEVVSRETWVQRAARDVLGGFATAAIALALLGLYGVLSYAVVERRRELGIRLALGATPAGLRLWVLRHGLALASFGIAIGWSLSLLAGRSLDFLLYEVSAVDATSLALAPLLVAALAAAATGLPAWRASSLDPARVLRSE